MKNRKIIPILTLALLSVTSCAPANKDSSAINISKMSSSDNSITYQLSAKNISAIQLESGFYKNNVAVNTTGYLSTNFNISNLTIQGNTTTGSFTITCNDSFNVEHEFRIFIPETNLSGKVTLNYQEKLISDYDLDLLSYGYGFINDTFFPEMYFDLNDAVYSEGSISHPNKDKVSLRIDNIVGYEGSMPLGTSYNPFRKWMNTAYGEEANALADSFLEFLLHGDVHNNLNLTGPNSPIMKIYDVNIPMYHDTYIEGDITTHDEEIFLNQCVEFFVSTGKTESDFNKFSDFIGKRDELYKVGIAYTILNGEDVVKNGITNSLDFLGINMNDQQLLLDESWVF